MADKNQANENGADDATDKDKPAEGEVATLKAQLESARNDLLYLRAEFDTYKRNAIKERSELVKYSGERVLVEMLNILDNFERALSVNVSNDNIDSYIKGVEMTAQEIRNLISKSGVMEIPALGQDFNPSVHEALSSEETEQFPEGQICRVFRKPYKLHDRVIRPGQVVVAKRPTTN